MARNKQPRYIEISSRNTVTRIFVGTSSSCGKSCSSPCSEICINIRRAGKSNCKEAEIYNSCCGYEPKPLCDRDVATVCAIEIDSEGYAVFEWPSHLLNLTQGWYEAEVVSHCNVCAILPLRIGPRCNVIEVETTIAGPDNLCYVGCEDDCVDEICPSGHSDQRPVYKPKYLG